MSRLIRVFSALATLASTAIAQESTNNGLVLPPTVEMDFIFPQNETYKNSDVFPIVLAVQNVSVLQAALSATEKARNFTAGYLWPRVAFHVDAYRQDGLMPGYTGLVTKYINLTDAVVTQSPDKGDYAILASVVNMTDILNMNSGRVGQPEYRYVVTYYVQVEPWQDENNRAFCDIRTAGITRIIFNIDRPQLQDYLPPDQLVRDPIEVDIMKSIPECPAYGSLVDILPNTTAPDTCPVYFEGHSERSPATEARKNRANPCALKVDKPILSAISSAVERLATPTTTSEEVSTSTSTGAAGLVTAWANPMQTALAAACVLCGLAL
ncbi:hypothetical protein QBC37DRAFT_36523 [Rhypophila decipiens]|uniref:DUF7136 domain-containing protein n=1 Tax=Rhypophila decipiens TaxID=261697 RepID=A0AAN6Y2R4_9PEZI|nr:hypothetical protein QBC37DRAFT_36523 [Rhypophila decipiens]